jgi:carbamoyl-phosphate synthase large subunit
LKRRARKSPRAAPGPITVLIAGIGGGSLGLEIFKSLRHAGGYRLIGTDVSEKAFGLYIEGFAETYLLRRQEGAAYAARLLEICAKEKVRAVAPGAEEVQTILSAHRTMFEQAGVLPMLNSEEVCALCSDKPRQMHFLASRQILVPITREIRSEGDLDGFDRFPCVVKPAAASGGSNLVFIAENAAEAKFFANYLHCRGFRPALQQYIPATDEFTVGVLSDRSGKIIGSIALRRFLEQKLSVTARYGNRVISSGWSQGEISDFPQVRRQAEKIALALNSTWALNIQGRLGEDGVFYPFEINPRHSGTTYLRALAGFNEPHILLQRCLRGGIPQASQLKKGYYLRALTEEQVPAREIRRRD